MEYLPKILVVDDEKDLREILEFNLSSEGFEIDTAESGEKALGLPLEDYDLILLDVMMGGISGYKLADKIRQEKQLDIPIIFLTAKDTENDLITGFNVGGDDYIRKPFSIKEVVVRINAVLKRKASTSSSTKILRHKKLILDTKSKILQIDKKQTLLTRKEFEILAFLLKNKGKYLSREEILIHIWKDDVIVTERNVDVNITRLRKKIGKYGASIVGRTGFGYCFEE